MESADYGTTDQAFSENQYSQQERLFVQFYIHPKQSSSKTLEAGRPIFEDTAYVRIITPGDKDNIIERPARLEDKRRFAQQYAAFKEGKEMQQTGTPLKMWPILSPAQVAELAYFKVFTVEQLSEISDVNLMGFMGGQTLKQKAAAFIEAAKSTAPLVAMQVELKSRDDTIAVMQQQIAELLKPKAKKAKREPEPDLPSEEPVEEEEEEEEE